MPRYAIDIEFLGAGFHGTQAQATTVRTLHAVLSAALAHLDDGPVRVRPASRLDAGVSAEHLPVDADLRRAWEPERLCLALATRLPRDVGVVRAAVVADAFDARTDAVAKTYRYRVLVRGTRPARATDAMWLPRALDAAPLHACAALLAGDLDLSAFACKRGGPRDDNDPHRVVHGDTWTELPCDHGRDLVFRITGAGFLYQQVRGLVGAMLHIARGAATVEDFRARIGAGWDVPRIGNMAPPEGLVLERVTYDPEPAWRAPSGGA
jgi:tRNA pseudouridine38-40 synthase